jgi:ABC-type lipoprotein export system ATPase subunit
MTSVIQAKNITKTYRMGDVEVRALAGVNINIEKGDFVAIMGASGSGKSTLMHIIGLLDSPTSGFVSLMSTDVSNLDDNERANLRNEHIGFVFQSFNLLARTSAIDNVSLPLVYASTTRSERYERARAALENVGLADRLDHTSAQLSGGQQQRVAIARALINNPSLILADEPTGNLDSKSGEEIMKILTDLNKKGNTIVMVTHEMDIARMAKRVVHMKDGEIIGDKKVK